jgi:hypothetical protein
MWLKGYEDAFAGNQIRSSDTDYLNGFDDGLMVLAYSAGYDDFVRGLAPQKDTDSYIDGYEDAFNDSQEDDDYE